jgi:site-specific recombinase XerD
VTSAPIKPVAAAARTQALAARRFGLPSPCADEKQAANPLSPLDQAQRDVILAMPGELARWMRVLETNTATRPAWLAELWLWVLHLTIVRGCRASTTVATYAHTLGAYARWVVAEGVDYADISLTQLDAWQKSLYLVRRNCASYRRRHLSGVRSFYKWRASRGYGRDCTDGLRGPALVLKTPKKYTRQQLRDLFAASRKGGTKLVSQRDEVLLLVLLATGLRREEIATLRIDQIEINNRTGLIRAEGKGAKERLIPIEGPVVQQLIGWLDARSKIEQLHADTVFVVARKNAALGRAMANEAIERTVARIAKRAGLGSWGVHRFRVTFATQMYDDGVDIERIRILMGHESIETTRRYLVVSSRMNRVRLTARRQHDVLGTRAVGFPKWAQNLEEKGNGPIFPPR